MRKLCAAVCNTPSPMSRSVSPAQTLLRKQAQKRRKDNKARRMRMGMNAAEIKEDIRTTRNARRRHLRKQMKLATRARRDKKQHAPNKKDRIARSKRVARRYQSILKKARATARASYESPVATRYAKAPSIEPDGPVWRSTNRSAKFMRAAAPPPIRRLAM
jgi:hypothetical protein